MGYGLINPSELAHNSSVSQSCSLLPIRHTSSSWKLSGNITVSSATFISLIFRCLHARRMNIKHVNTEDAPLHKSVITAYTNTNVMHGEINGVNVVKY